MVESDEEYAPGISDDEVEAHNVTRGSRGGRKRKDRTSPGQAFEVRRTWDDVEEGADGTINQAIEGSRDAEKRKRTLKDTTPLQRGIIRHLIVIMDLSSAMLEKDLRPTRYLLTIRYCEEFVTEFFEQNPISQIGIIGMRDGLAIRVSDMSGNPNDHISNLQALRKKEPKGQPSLQNALDMARAALFHAPSHGTREILLLFGSLLSSDPGDVHETIKALVASHISCTVIGLSAQVAICLELVQKTNPRSGNPQKHYNVAMDEVSYRELIMRLATPPEAHAAELTTANGLPASKENSNKSSLLMMGFPSRITSPMPSLCACHSKPTTGGYLCSRCESKVCSLPTTCPACGLTLILSTHLARSYHHLFPLQNWRVVSWGRALSIRNKTKDKCFGCLTPFPPSRPPLPLQHLSLASRRNSEVGHAADVNGIDVGSRDGVSESGRYACPTCSSFFCIDCDVFCHEVVHNCPGCQSREGEMMNGVENGIGGEEEKMEVDGEG